MMSAGGERQPGGARLRAYIRSHRRLAWIASGAVVVTLAFVLIWFQPQKLFLEETVNEALPAAGSEPGDSSGSSNSGKTDPQRTETLAEGHFQGLEHSTRGRASILELADGSQFLRFDDLETSNGPDLRVYLSEVAASDDWRAYGERFVDLGPLKGNRGDQNYELPRDLDLSRYKSAVIWCRRFTVGFGVAPLDELSGASQPTN